MRALSALVFLVLAGSAVAAALGSQGGSAAEVSAVATAGSFSLASPGDGEPIFSASGIAPGDSASGSVEIANSGEVPAALELAQHDLADVTGSGGGELSTRLKLRITDVTAPAHPVTIYAGPLAPMPAQAAGRLQPGESRTYEFVATLPEAGPTGAGAQNDVQGASTSVAFAWTASEVAASPEPPAQPRAPASNPPAAPPGLEAPPAKLRLRITRVERRIRHGRIVVWARCNSACAIAARGRLDAGGPVGHRTAELRPGPRPKFVAGTQRLALRIPRQLRRWPRAHSRPPRARVRLSLSASNPAGERATARRSVQVRLPRPHPRLRGS